MLVPTGALENSVAFSLQGAHVAVMSSSCTTLRRAARLAVLLLLLAAAIADGESSWQPPAVLLIVAHIDALMLPYLAAPIHLPTVSIEPWRAEHLEW